MVGDSLSTFASGGAGHLGSTSDSSGSPVSGEFWNDLLEVRFQVGNNRSDFLARQPQKVPPSQWPLAGPSTCTPTLGRVMV